MIVASNKKISSILEDIYNKSSIDNPKSILFVSELDDTVKKNIVSWGNKHTFYEKTPSFYYEEIDGKLIKTNDYGFDSSIEGNEIVYQHHEVSYHDAEFKNTYHKTIQNLINKEGFVVDRDLRLVIVSVYYPLWSGNSPMYGENDYSKFDEVVLLKIDKEEFKEEFKKYIDDCKNGILSNFNIETDEAKKHLEVICNEERKGMYILNHSLFDFIPIENDNNSDFNDFFSPVEFYRLISIVKDEDDISMLNLSNKAYEMINKIMNDYFSSIK